MAIWQNWCFGHFYHSRIEVLQNCSACLSVSFSLEKKSERNETKFKTQNPIQTREWNLLGHLATSRGLQADMLMAISAAFGQLLALETDNVKHLQEAMTKVLHEMPMSERKGLVQCLVYQKDNLATCLAFPNLGECLFLKIVGHDRC